jgi:hypothetical protein
VQCPHCDLFGHVNKKDCKYKHCINVEVDWLNILLSVSASHTITELFKASECTVDPNSLRSGGKFRKFTDWEHVKQACDSIGFFFGNQFHYPLHRGEDPLWPGGRRKVREKFKGRVP